MHRRIRLLIIAAVYAPFASAQPKDTLYHSQYAVWVAEHSLASECAKYKTNIDSIEKQLDAAFPVIDEFIGLKPEKMPLVVNIDPETDGLGGWAGGGEVGYQISDFYGAPKNSDGLRWIRGVVIGEVINASTGAVTGDWPNDWWVDHVWYFPGFIAGEVLKRTVSAQFGDYWLTTEDYPTYPVYNQFTGLLKEFGWAYFKTFFTRIKADKMDWGEVGSNPSANKTNYVLAYLSLAAGRNLASQFIDASVDGADQAAVAAIINVEQRLLEGDKQKLNTASAWRSFRSGDYQSAKTALDQLGVSAIRPLRAASAGFPGHVAYSLTGRRLMLQGNTEDTGDRGVRFIYRR